MEHQGVIDFLNDRLQLNIGVSRPRSFMRKWRDLADRMDHLRKDVNIALVGKYTKLEDSYASVTKACQHAAIEAGYKLNLTVLSRNTVSQLFEIYIILYILYNHILCYYFLNDYIIILLLQFIEAANLEQITLVENPVLYHEAWTQLCKSK